MDDLHYTRPLSDAVLYGLNKRFGDLLEQDKKTAYDALLATATHPQFRLSQIKPELRPFVQDAIISEAQELQNPPSPDTPPAPKKPKVDPYFSFSYDDVSKSKQSTRKDNDIKIEVLRFLEDDKEDSSSVQMLHRYPAVKRYSNVFSLLFLAMPNGKVDLMKF